MNPVKDMPSADAGRHMLEEWQATEVTEGASEGMVVSVPGKPADFAGSDAVRYKTTFEDPREPGDDVAVLELCGLYAHSEIEVTGRRLDGEGVLEHDTYFTPVRIPFEPYEDNDLVVTCHAPRDRFGGLHDTDLVPDSDCVPGIWWGATLETHELPFIDTIDVHPEMTDEGVRLHVQTTVVTDEQLSERITYSLKPEGDLKTRGMMERASVETDGPGKTTVEHTIDVRDPALWWPRELGEQNRYTLRAKLDETEHTVTTGICDVTCEDGHVVVNGEPLPIRGVNLLTADQADVQRALDVNANLVRAHAHVVPDSFYEQCDQEGLLVWQDLPLTGPGAVDTDRGVTLAEQLPRQYARHPSLAVYGVHDDPVERFTDGLGSGFFDRLRLRWRAWRTSYDPTPAETIANALPEHRPVFPVIGGPGLDSDAGSYYPGWDYGNAGDIDTLLARYPVEVVAEFGAGALADEDVENAAGFDAAKHATRAEGVEDSQAYQAAVLSTVTERLRQSGVGAIAFALRDTDSAGPGVYSHDGTPKAGRDALATAFVPVQVFLADPSPGESKVVVVNDRPRSLSTMVEWAAGEESGELDVTVQSTDRWTGGPITVPADGTVELSLTVNGQQVENEYGL
jgi:beta-mannosidase